MSLSGPNLQLFSTYLRGSNSWKSMVTGPSCMGDGPTSSSASGRACSGQCGRRGNICSCAAQWFAFVWMPGCFHLLGMSGSLYASISRNSLVLCGQVLHLKIWYLTVSHLHFAVTWLFSSTPHGQLLLCHECSHSLISCDWPYSLAALWMGFIWTIFIWGK
jgi:hypothetical protein